MSVPIRVAENHQGRYNQTVSAGAHTFFADEPPSLGGADTGAAPYDLLLASLGACTSITLRMYAERKNLPLTHVEVALHHEKVEQDGKSVDKITRQIHLEGDLSDEQRQRLLEIANKCPIHRLLSHAPLIESSLA